MLSGVYVYAHDAVDITTTGLVGDLMPTKCLFEEEKNGKSVLTMTLQYDKWGKWQAVKNGNYIKAMVPVRVPPKIVNNKYAEHVATYRVKKGLSKDVTLYTSSGVADKNYPNSESFRLNYTTDSTAVVKPVKVKRYLKAGSEVQVLEEKSDGRCKVYNKDYGSGWTFMENLELVKTSTIKQQLDGVEAVSNSVKFQYQLFQVEHVEQTLRGMNVTANHVFYELAKNYTNYENAADMEAFVTINGVMDSMVTPDARFTVLTDCEDSAGAVDYRQTNVAQAFLDPENGICAKYGLSLIRDNYDAYALKDVGSDRGFVVEYARNMLGVECVEDITETITRLVPYGMDKSGNPVYLDNTYIDSEHIGNYAFPRIAYLDCSDSATESDTMTIAQVKAELRRRAEEEFANGIDKPKLSMTVQFIPLGDTEEYKQYRDLDKVFLFDRITVKDSVRMYDYSAEVVGMVYNVLTRRMESCTIGSLQKGTGVRKVAVWQVPTIDGGNIRLKSVKASTLSDGVGNQLDLSGNANIVGIQHALNGLSANYVQYATPENPKKGDVWINTGNDVWENLLSKTWKDARRNAWAHYYNPTPVTRVWDGTAWQMIADQKTALAVEQKADALSIRVETMSNTIPDKVVNSSLTLDKKGLDMYGGEVNIRAGSRMHVEAGSEFTIDAPNFNVDENGDVSINGGLMQQGFPVLNAQNLVVSTNQPDNPIIGTVWVRPNDSTVASFAYNNPSVVSFKTMETEHILTNKSSAIDASGDCTYNISIPYKVISPVTATRYLRMTVMAGEGVQLFDEPLASTAGTHTLRVTKTLPQWLGDTKTLPFTLKLHFLQGDESYLHNVHRLNTGAIELHMMAGGSSADGWVDATVKVYNG